eukprot:TRINITY_DN11770_c0_g1_i4.p1 TRINITY_DN11770_c0_g1~~TRINITY_DN11770_c0_g1_i4.p1  ORF type:complete len:135 (-),score=31.71 TRINITY_DN11770_c0_g1_i4:96-440(-)
MCIRDRRRVHGVYGRILAQKHYEKLYKEFVITDLSRAHTGKIGMRWRTEDEVLNGKGETICCARKCKETKGLCSYELLFSYREDNQIKSALVKARCCRECAAKLNSKKTHKKLD